MVSEVLRRNPTRQAAIAAWQATSQRYPQEIALDDPMFETIIGPRGLASDQVNGAYMVGVSQKLPWTGKRALRGESALWEQTAAQWDVADVELRLTEAAKLAFYEYYLATRKLEVRHDSEQRLKAYRETALSKYETAQVTQQDVLQTDVELAQLERRRIELQREQQIAAAKINTLLHRPPETALPPAPMRLDADRAVLSATALHQIAVRCRPDLTAMSARIQSERTAIELACKEFYPDFEVMARYDAFWQEKPLRPMVGMNVNIPLNQSRRHAAVNEATFRLNKMCAEYSAAVDATRNDVQATWEKLDASRQVVALYEQSILKTAESNIESAEAGYVAGTVDFLRLVEAQRQLIDLREQYHEAVTEYRSRLAELERLVAQPILETHGPVPAASPSAPDAPEETLP
ncbi:TolC family protein [Caulifigura coniformis]|nr:TolC family protein [Caulifigura coniformis]